MEGRSKVSHKSLKWAQCARTNAMDAQEAFAWIPPSSFWVEAKPTISSSRTKLAEMMLIGQQQATLSNTFQKESLSSPVIDLMLKGREILLSHCEMMWLWGLYSNCHSGWRCGSVTVSNDEFVTAMVRVFVWVISKRGQPGQLTAGVSQESGTPQGTGAESAESFPHLRKVELSSVVMTQLASSGVRSPDVHISLLLQNDFNTLVGRYCFSASSFDSYFFITIYLFFSGWRFVIFFLVFLIVGSYC